MSNVKKTIGWADYTCNCFWGCGNNCPYCTARRLAWRFGKYLGDKRGYPADIAQCMKEHKPVFLPDQLAGVAKIKKPSKIFISEMGDWMGVWNKPGWIEETLKVMRAFDQHTYLTLTKYPENLPNWTPYPDNCWPGVSVTANGDASLAYQGLSQVEAGGRYISFEPLHGQIGTDELRQLSKVTDWWIIGAQTPYSKKTAPRIEWVREIVAEADKAGIQVFLKGNLHKVFEEHIHVGAIGRYDGYMLPSWAGKITGDNRRALRQEFPAKIGVK